MGRYRVEIEELTTYRVYVDEADTPEEASDEAEARFLDSDLNEYFVAVQTREVTPHEAEEDAGDG